MSKSAPSVSDMVAAIYNRVQAAMAAGVKVSPHWRVQGDDLPAVMYEVTTAEWWPTIDTGRVNAATITMNWSCVAMTQGAALDIADKITNTVASQTTYNSITFCATSISYRAADQTPDDGTGDRDRVVVVTTTIHAQDEGSGGVAPI